MSIEYIVELKSGTKIRTPLNDVEGLFVNINKAAASDAKNILYADGGYMFNLSEIAAIYPLAELIPKEMPEL